MIYLLHGADTFTSLARLRELRASLDPAGFNSTSLDGQESSLDTLRTDADALPFFGGGRCVDVRGLLTRWGAGGKKPAKTRADADPLTSLAAYLPAMPPTTTLIFWEPGPVELPAGLRQVWQQLQARVEHFAAPLGRDLQAWVTARTRAHGVTIRPDAVMALLDAVCPHGWRELPRGRDAPPPDLQRIDTELAKLATAICGRAGGEEPVITARDVAVLTAGEEVSSVFDLVNAVAGGNTGAALARLRRLLDEGVAPEAILPLLARQFSDLARLAAAGSSRAERGAVAQRLGLNPNRLHHLARQLDQLGTTRAARCLTIVLEADEAIKTGQAPRSDDALYWAILELCAAGPPGPSLLQTTSGA